MIKGKKPASGSNFISEWFGHRVYPEAIASAVAVEDQVAGRCPFLSEAKGEFTECIKNPQSKGVCSVNCSSNGSRQDWLVCPYRVLNTEIVVGAIRRLFALSQDSNPYVTSAVSLSKPDVREDVQNRLRAGEPVFAYFDEKTGGELSIPATDRSPEFSFDVTIIELSHRDGKPHIGRFGILEIQTTDFHGSYKHAVRNLNDVLRLHRCTFAETLRNNGGRWISEGVEGPNIANVFKRTFYQMMFKFQLGQHAQCAGCVLAVPQSVWDSWQKHLGKPKISDGGDGTFNLLEPGRPKPHTFPAWVFVFDSDTSSPQTPSPIIVRQVIGTNAPAFSHWALNVAPAAALSNVGAEYGFLSALSRRLKNFWPELAKTAIAEIPVEAVPGKKASKKGRKKKEVPLTEVETVSSYSGPGTEAIHGDHFEHE